MPGTLIRLAFVFPQILLLSPGFPLPMLPGQKFLFSLLNLCCPCFVVYSLWNQRFYSLWSLCCAVYPLWNRHFYSLWSLCCAVYPLWSRRFCSLWSLCCAVYLLWNRHFYFPCWLFYRLLIFLYFQSTFYFLLQSLFGATLGLQSDYYTYIELHHSFQPVRRVLLHPQPIEC